MNKRNRLIHQYCVFIATIILLSSFFEAKTESFVFIHDIKEKAPKVFRFSETVNGTEVNIEAPISLPQADTMPISSVSYLPIGTSEESQRINNILASSLETAKLKVQQTAYKWSASIFSSDSSRMTTYNKKGYSLEFPSVADDQAVGSPVIPEVPFQTITSIFSLIYPELKIYLKGQYATGGGYLVKAGSVGKTDEELLQSAPQPGHETGYYNLLIGQFIHGVPIFPDSYFAIVNEGDPGEPTARVIVNPFFNPDAYNMTMQMVQNREVLIENAELVPFSSIETILVNRIRSGLIREIDSISLGYMLYYLKPYTPEQAANEDIEMIIVPTWEIIGDVNMDMQPDAPKASIKEKKIRLVSSHSGMYSLRIDALTGKVLDKYANPSPRVYTIDNKTKP